MIKRFHALYVGQIELDNLGLDGTPANDRRYPNSRLSEVFAASRDVARVMDELGYYCFWGAEHHFQREGYECIPNLIQWGLWLATQTRRLKFGSASTFCRCGIRSASPRITRWRISSPTGASSWASRAAITRARSRRSARHCLTLPLTATCSRSSYSSC